MSSLLVLAWVLAGAGFARAAGLVALETPGLEPPGQAAPLRVSISGVAPGAPLPTNYALNGRNVSPPVIWTAGPSSTRAYAVVMEDPDAPGGRPTVHWVVYAIPSDLTALPRGVRNLEQPTHPPGILQGRNDHGGVGYSGPHPPTGDPPHHYHLQVFALDRPARLGLGADLPALERAMAGHVVAAGELVATYPGPQSGKGGSAGPPSNAGA